MSRSAALNEILLDHLRTIEAHVWPGIDGLTLDVVLGSYVQAALAGQVPNKDELLQLHPELAAELDVLFAHLEPVLKRHADPQISPLYYEHTD